MRSDGSIYFSDPWYGRMPVLRRRASATARLSGRLSPAPGGGAPQLLVDRYLFDQPNGLCFSPDEQRLYVNDTVQALIRVFDVAADGSLVQRPRSSRRGIRSAQERGVPDGMKCDARGNVWVTAPGGVWVYAPSGDLIGKVRVPELVANLAWGGAGFRDPVHDRDPFGLHRRDQGRPAPEPYMNASARRAVGSARHANRDAAAAASLNSIRGAAP